MMNRKRTNFLAKVLVTALGTCALALQAGASIVVEFSESNGNVYATTSGTFTMPLAPRLTTFNGNDAISGSFRTLYYLPGTIGLFQGGETTNTQMTTLPTLAFGDAFGFASGGTLYMPSSLAPGDVYSPVTTFVWENRTLAQLNITSTPVLAFTYGSETITYVAAPVPEPSAMVLLLGGIGSACSLRRRK